MFLNQRPAKRVRLGYVLLEDSVISLYKMIHEERSIFGEVIAIVQLEEEALDDRNLWRIHFGR